MNYELGRFTQVFGVMLAGGVLGIGSALLAVDLIYKSETEITGSWRAASDAQLVRENRWVRTAEALSGAWVPPGGITLEWTALRDSQGERLKGHCAYYLIGKPEVGSLWSVTVYNNDHNLPVASGSPQSIVSADVQADGQGQVQVQAGGPDQGGAWLPADPGSFSITYRAYGVTETGDAAPVNLPFFTIHRGECG